jgi:hypothetical protein
MAKKRVKKVKLEELKVHDREVDGYATFGGSFDGLDMKLRLPDANREFLDEQRFAESDAEVKAKLQEEGGWYLACAWGLTTAVQCRAIKAQVNASVKGTPVKAVKPAKFDGYALVKVGQTTDFRGVQFELNKAGVHLKNLVKLDDISEYI